MAGQLRKTEVGKAIYAQRKETIERVFADAKEKRGMRYTQYRGLARVTAWVRLKYAAMNLILESIKNKTIVLIRYNKLRKLNRA